MEPAEQSAQTDSPLSRPAKKLWSGIGQGLGKGQAR